MDGSSLKLHPSRTLKIIYCFNVSTTKLNYSDI